MAQFVYQPYQNPYVNSISQLIARQGEIPAQAALAAGNAQANAAVQSGQAIGGAIQSIGQIPQQMQQMKQQQLQQEAIATRTAIEKQQLANAQRVQAAQQRINELASDPSVFNDDGTFNLKGIAGKMSSMPGGAAGPVQPPDLTTIASIIDPLNEHIAKARDSREKWENDKQNALARIASTAYTLGAPNAQQPNGSYVEHAQVGLAAALKSGLINQDEANKFLVPLIENPQSAPQLLQVIAAHNTLAPIKKGKDEELLDPLNPQRVLVGPTATPPKTRAELAADAANPNSPTQKQSATALDLMTPPKEPTPKALQRESVMLDGKPAIVQVDPDPAAKVKVFDLTGKPIDNAAARVKPIPPAAIQVQNMVGGALQNLPEWATDDSRPGKGPESNKVDSKVRMTPNGLYQAATNYIATGQYPPTGRGNDESAQLVRTAINSKVGAIAASAGMDVPALRAFYKSNAASLAQQQKSYDSVQGFMATADRNADLLDQTLAKIPDSGVPVFNGPLRDLAKKFGGSPEVSQFSTYLKSVQNEYARIISQPNLAGQLTDSARKEAEQLIDPNATVQQIMASLQALRNEGSNRLTSIGEQIQRIQSRIGGGQNQTPQVERWERGPDGTLRRVSR
jgi:hypothetical protein